MSQEACSLVSPKEFARQLELLRRVKTIAVIGMSPNSSRPSHEVGLFLHEKGYHVLPVHPTAANIGPLSVFPTLTAAAGKAKIDLVDLFVSGDRVGAIITEANRLGIKQVWFQPGSENPEAADEARKLGMEVVIGACTMAVLARAEA
jgi:hypothetical protein